MDSNVIPATQMICLGEALSEKIETLERVREREMNGDFDYAGSDISKIDKLEDLIDVCILKTPQNKGWILEDFICRKLGWKHLPPWKHCGDGYDLAEKRSYEIKSSFTTDGILMKQVRLFQKISRYLYVRIDEHDLSKSDVFVITHEDMVKVVKSYGRKSSKGRSRRGGNQYDVEIPPDTPEFRSFKRHFSDKWMKKKLFS